MTWTLASRWATRVVLLIVVSVGGGGMVACQPSGRGAHSPGADSVATSVPADRDSARLGAEPELDSAEAVSAVIRAYYLAIDERRYGDAYQLWGSQGTASHQSFDAFRSGFSETANVSVMPGTPGRLDAAAGSRYVEVPVHVRATLKNGTLQEFAGSYTLRRSVVDGATAEQRSWRIYTAKLRQMR